MTVEIMERDGDARRAIERRLADVLDAVHAGDLQRLAGYHLDSPKFTKFNDSPPVERQDFATAMDAEAAEFTALDEIRGAFEDVKIDVLGEVAVVTGLFAYEASVGDAELSGRVRSTVIMVDDAGDWKIAHEHLSVLPRTPVISGDGCRRRDRSPAPEACACAACCPSDTTSPHGSCGSGAWGRLHVRVSEVLVKPR